MTDISESPVKPRKGEAGRALRWILILQIVFALILLGTDLFTALPRMLSPSEAPQLTQPIGPGDQTRRYAPADLPQRAPQPGTRPVPATTDMPSRLTFVDTVWDGAPVITLTGQIAPGDADRFADFIAAVDPAPATAFLNSPGGSVSDALAIGRMIRKLDAATALTGADICLSACPYILAAGIERRVDPDALVGVHQHFFDANTVLPAFLAARDIQRGQGEVMAYLNEMGVDPLLMQPALLTPPEDIYILTPTELADYRLTTPAE